MNKRILISLSIIGVVAVIGIGGTVAYYNDTETSQGNMFVAGSIDLKVDSASYYNGHICRNGFWECEPWADHIASFNQGTKNNGGAVPSERSNPTKALGEAENNDTYNFVSLGMGFGGEIVLKFDNLILNETGNDIEIVETSFGSPDCAQYPERAKVWVSQDGIIWDEIGDVCVDGALDMDNGALQFAWAKYVKIKDTSNPADFGGDADGYDVDGVRAIHCGTQPDLTGQVCDGSWNFANFEDQKFFNFVDIKPGDSGKNVISLHTFDNDAWACVIIDNLENNDNGCTEPEGLPEGVDTTCGDNEGELAQNLYFFAWTDDGDSLFEPDQGELPLFTNISGPASDVLDGKTYIIADSTTGQPLINCENYYIGLAWCAGDLFVNQTTGNITCDASGMGNDCQSDSLSADITFYAEQARHNPDFVCELPENGEDCTENDECISITLIPSNTPPNYRFEITNDCDKALSHVAFELPTGFPAESPVNGGTYIGNHNSYNIENTTNNPFYSIKFETIGEGIKDGETEIFEYTMPIGAPVLSPMRVSAKAGNNTYQVIIDINQCID